MRARWKSDGDDSGFTLLEVVLSLAMLGVVATGALYFFVGAQKSVSQQQRAQTAVTVANEAMEAAFGVDARTSGSDPSAVVKGRTKAASQTAWTTATSYGLTGVASSYLAWDSTATTASTPLIPITATRTLDNIPYTVYTLVGSCYRSTSSTSDDCVRPTTTEPTSVPANSAKMYRVMVLVTWSGASCTAGTCSYQTQSLVDPNTDIKWNSTTVPYAMDDVAVTQPNTKVNIDVLHNDQIGTVLTSPVQDLTKVTPNSTEVITSKSDGTVDFTPPTNTAGVMTFKYRLKDQSGRWSGFATVTVQVMPTAANDSVTTTKNTPTTVAVTSNDIGTAASMTIEIPPTHGTASVSGSSIVYTPTTGYTGSDSMEYTFLDPSGLKSTQAKLSVSVTDYANPLAADLTVSIPASQTGRSDAVDWLTLTGNPAGYQLKVLSFAGQNGTKAILDGTAFLTTRTGTTLGFAQQGNILSSGQVLQYQVLTPDSGKTSATKSITVTVVPDAVNDAFNVVSKKSDTALQVGTNDAPNNYASLVKITSVGSFSTGCSQVTNAGDLANGIVHVKNTLNATKTCTFTYTITGTGAYTSLTDTATVTLTATS